MPARPKDLFAVDYQFVAGKGLIAQGGLKFKTDEMELRKNHRRVLDKVALQTVVGEAALWVLWPSTAAIWTFPLFLWTMAIDRAILAAIGVFLAVQIVTMLFYSRRANYAVLALGNRLLQAAVYLVYGILFWRFGAPMKVVALAVWLLLMATGVVQVIFVTPFAPILRRIFAEGPADRALRNVLRRHEKRLRNR